jgi:mannosyl-oligosaccharide alpha-1,2-mannosidase
MLAMGSKIFSRPHDLRLAEKLTDGCVWAYNATRTGIMPENFHVEVCYEKPCHWVPNPLSETEQNLNTLNQMLNGNKPVPGENGNHRSTKRAAEPDPQQADRAGPPLPEPPHEENGDEIVIVENNAMSDVDPEVEALALNRQQETHTKRKNSRPPSFSAVMDARYILRPEAIESVFYMWRITGDPEWQEKGWRMWESIENATRTEMAYSAISSVNDPESRKTDSMERYALRKEEWLNGSFWIAETLKYFYLLYSEPGVISLDEWVFNTEAHPFKRPVAGGR